VASVPSRHRGAEADRGARANGPAEPCLFGDYTMAHPRFQCANAGHRTVHAGHRTSHAAFQAVGTRFRTSSAGFESPLPRMRTSLARKRAVEGHFRDREAREERSGRGTPCPSDAGRGVEAGIGGRTHLLPRVRCEKSVVVAELGKKQRVCFNLIDHTMLIRDAARPVSGQTMFQRFGLAKTRKGCPRDLLDESIDPFEDFAVCALPISNLPRRARRK
jgi:hypothetical protein